MLHVVYFGVLEKQFKFSLLFSDTRLYLDHLLTIMYIIASLFHHRYDTLRLALYAVRVAVALGCLCLSPALLAFTGKVSAWGKGWTLSVFFAFLASLILWRLLLLFDNPKPFTVQSGVALLSALVFVNCVYILPE